MHGDRASWEYLENWPILKKELLREHNKQFVSNDKPLTTLFQDRTSGTTGTPISSYVAAETLRHCMQFLKPEYETGTGFRFEIAGNHGGQMVVPFHQTKPPYGVRNFALNQLYLSTTISHLHLYNGMPRLKIILAHTYDRISILSLFTGYSCQRTNIEMPPMKVIFSNAEHYKKTKEISSQKHLIASY